MVRVAAFRTLQKHLHWEISCNLLLLFDRRHTCSRVDETNWNVPCSSPRLHPHSFCRTVAPSGHVVRLSWSGHLDHTGCRGWERSTASGTCAVMYYDDRQRKSFQPSFQSQSNCFGDQSPSRSTVHHWCKEFQFDRTTFENSDHCGYPVTVRCYRTKRGQGKVSD